VSADTTLRPFIFAINWIRGCQTTLHAPGEQTQVDALGTGKQ